MERTTWTAARLPPLWPAWPLHFPRPSPLQPPPPWRLLHLQPPPLLLRSLLLNILKPLSPSSTLCSANAETSPTGKTTPPTTTTLVSSSPTTLSTTQSEKAKGLSSVFDSHLKELNAPFHEASDKAGWFLATNAEAKSWLESKCSIKAIAALNSRALGVATMALQH